MWTRHLRKSSLSVVKFNAWQTDFAVDPFLALSEELAEELKSHKDALGHKVDDFKAATLKILRQVGPELARTVVSALLGSTVGGVAGDALASRC